MVFYGTSRRSKGRAKREFSVKIKTAAEQKQVYTLDLSAGGVRIGAPLLRLVTGEKVELLFETAGVVTSFAGHVARIDGIHRLNRISRDVSAFFIRIDDANFAEFVKKSYNV